jgi:hypothetical protein
MTRAELFGLMRYAQLASGQMAFHLLPAVTYDDDRGSGSQVLDGGENMIEQWRFRQRLKDLGQRRTHAFTLACGQNYGNDWGLFRFAVSHHALRLRSEIRYRYVSFAE